MFDNLKKKTCKYIRWNYKFTRYSVFITNHGCGDAREIGRKDFSMRSP